MVSCTHFGMVALRLSVEKEHGKSVESYRLDRK